MEGRMVLAESLSVEEKLAILSDAAKYDVACTSSGMQREGEAGSIGNSCASGICHSFSADGRCISLLKVLYTNECIFDCKYCTNRSSNDVVRTSFTPRELCELTMGFYKRNYIEGLFLSSGILHTPDYTMTQIVEALRMLRNDYRFRGYIHCKAIPGANPALVEEAGWYADRMSVNLELPTTEGLRALAPNKTRKNILLPMRQIQSGIDESREVLGARGGNRSAFWFTRQAAQRAGLEDRFCVSSVVGEPDSMKGIEVKGNPDPMKGIEVKGASETKEFPAAKACVSKSADSERKREKDSFLPSATGRDSFRLQMLSENFDKRGFAPAGQSTQMIIGATPETDLQLISVTEALYQRFDLKRVFYSAFVKVNDDSLLPDLPGGPPLLREHRLYQADWLMRFYGFRAGELLTQKRPNFSPVLDPKCDWAVNHLEAFPVEVMSADYFLLLRVPGIGPKSARRIVEARKNGSLTFEALKKIGVVLKRAQYFLTCQGKTLVSFPMDSAYITGNLAIGEKLPKNLQEALYGRQISLFELPAFAAGGG